MLNINPHLILDSKLEEPIIINKNYYENLKDQLICPICYNFLFNPLMCNNCEKVFCKPCIDQLVSSNMCCPNRCPKNKDALRQVNRYIKDNLDGLKFRCRYGCEIPMLSYDSHIKKCHDDHKDDIKCWNCSNNSHPYTMKQVNEEDIHALKKEHEDTKNKHNTLRKQLQESKDEQDYLTNFYLYYQNYLY